MRERPLRNQAGQTLEEFLAAYHPKDYPHPSVTVDLLIFSLERARPELLMIRQGNHPYLGCWALPGALWSPRSLLRTPPPGSWRRRPMCGGSPCRRSACSAVPTRIPGLDHVLRLCRHRPAQQTADPGDDDAAEAAWFQLQYHMSQGTLALKLSREEEVLRARVQAEPRQTALGTEYHLGGV